MKKSTIFMLSTIAFLGIACKKTYVSKRERCKVSNVSWQYKYGGLTNEKIYTIKTSNGYTIVSHIGPKVGDSIDVEVRYFNKKDW
jgi:hypothetical protein